MKKTTLAKALLSLSLLVPVIAQTGCDERLAFGGAFGPPIGFYDEDDLEDYYDDLEDYYDDLYDDDGWYFGFEYWDWGWGDWGYWDDGWYYDEYYYYDDWYWKGKTADQAA